MNQLEGLQIDNLESEHGVPYLERKRFCCRAIKRLQEKCLRFHDNNEEACGEIIKGYQQCKVVKEAYEAKWKEMFEKKEVL